MTTSGLEATAWVLPAMPKLARRLLVGISSSSIGSGLTLPFLFVYYTEVRDLPTQTVGLLFAWMGVLSFACAPFGGTLIDRFGARRNGLPLIWLLLTVGGTAAGAGAFLHLGRRLTSSQEGLTGADQVVSTELIEAHQRTAEVSSAS